MVSSAPYLYNPPKKWNAYDPYHGFNPKAVSQASLIRPTPRPKQVGPLLDLNRHPDTYKPTPFGHHGAMPMHKDTKKRVNRARLTLLTLRVLGIICTIGILFCVIGLKMPKSTEAWLIRIPVGIDVVISIYHIYTLARNSKVRTPTNSVTYHIFGLIMDVGLVPFYISIIMVANAQYRLETGTKGRWTSFLDSTYATNQLIQTTWMSSAAMVCLHGFLSFIDLYMVIIFRKIAILPPDMNPLEDDNLTRRKSKHRYKNSEITLVDEKHMSDFMGTTAASTPNRMSRASESSHSKDSRRISFAKSRTGEQNSYNPHNPKSAHISRTSLADTMYQQNGGGASRVNLNRDSDFGDDTYSHRTSAMPALHPNMPKRSSVVSTHSSEARSIRNSREDLAKDNAWFVVGDDDAEETQQVEPPRASRVNPYASYAYASQPHHSLQDPPQRSPQRSPQRQPQHPAQQMPFAHPMGADYRNYQQPVQVDNSHLPAGHPLHMNPPTPRNSHLPRSPPSPPPQPIAPRNASRPLSTPTIGFSHHLSTHSRADDEFLDHAERSKTMTSEVSAVSGSSKYSDQETTISDLTNSTRTAPSRQLYGDLAAAMRGVRHQPLISPRPTSMVGSLHWASSDVSSSDAASNPSSRGGRSQRGTIVRKDRPPVSDVEEDDDLPLGNKFSGLGRVVSRSGVDIMNSRGDLGNARRREVSGKVAEEGRAGTNSGWFASGMFRRVSGLQS